MTDDHTPPVPSPASPGDLERLLAIMARLRTPEGGCPWDLAQTFASIAPHTLEEAYEVADAIERGHMEDLKDELGDLLFQVVFHARMAQEAGHFTFADVVAAIADKMERRHPHIFGGDAAIADAAAQTEAWEALKQAERAAKAHTGVLDGLTVGLPATVRSQKIGQRVARVGFDWPDPNRLLDKVQEELDEVRAEVNAGAPKERVTDEVGDLMFTCVQLARKLSVDAESALRHTNTKFERRFRYLESRLAATGREATDASLEEMEALWHEAKGEVG
ncbi:nucleoside triphosphate pyrophosphohydrolase [Roseospira marina]|uniref:Nucleoside triphosphate pyrophosphohydrolase n=1 Tax=Roseospira marina TaxID=140057 RepID=A0A5M6I8W0_9PROT|nr:nucleoside triphosphate pyrophosphohydrolase [Roseospira marina]KAA5604621.1 nucleoside triphosphate pyrophosphohydrolase [Roseospira marina]MBB4315343.1 MazG family protein [Roseospira marina]